MLCWDVIIYCKSQPRLSLSNETLINSLPYDRWLVPPRAIIGDIDAVYGSSDHCSILMGRVATFAAKDRSRKIKAMAQDAQRQSLSGKIDRRIRVRVDLILNIE